MIERNFHSSSCQTMNRTWCHREHINLPSVSPGAGMIAVLIFFSSYLFTGCIASVNHQVAPEHLTTSIALQQTTKQEVQRLLGPPNWLQTFPSEENSHERWSYWWTGGRHINKENSLLTVGTLAPVADATSSQSQMYGLTIAFSKDGRVHSITRHAPRER